ncbi:MAG: DUF2953 domain-containing protein [Oscillospiraceae bacterium]|nr:DUF2953 domain-containing protein [Oscillospiraceae bacterium]
MTGWIIFGTILLLLLVLLLIPIILRVEYREDWKVTAGYLFLRFPLYPAGEKKKKPSKAEKKPSGEKKKEKKTGGKKMPLTDLVATVLDLVQSAGGGLRMLLRNLRVTDLDLQMAVGRGDAAETGVQYGRLCAYLYGAYAVLEHYIRMKRVRLNLWPDFLAEEDNWTLSFQLRLTPLTAVAAAVRIAASFLWKQIRRKSETKPESSGSDKEQAGACAPAADK